MNCNFINIDDNNILILDNVYQISTLLNIDLFQNKFIKFDKSYLPKYIKKLKKNGYQCYYIDKLSRL
tara:strand:+ start:463 stop:663 length:201 start_codon:yes stop_codon:yes gene_type:complete